ncbi:MAG: Hsp20/alpha crystallin family protein [Armatimonadetes bacterium]|jgi:HSP20 family protein|nr:Hsp20/alpha crystallin family protein [Armatimonadota bacterium]
MATWYPFRDVDAIRREIDRVFAGLEPGRSGWARGAFLPGRSARAYPLTNLAEDADNVYVHALAPGIDPEALDITVLRNTLTISGAKLGPEGVKAEQFHRNERAAGRFVRTVELPVEVQADQVSAAYTDGVLSITLPKAEIAKPRQIQVAVR